MYMDKIVSMCGGPRGATVARLTPDQKVACSNHVGVIFWSSCEFPVRRPKNYIPLSNCSCKKNTKGSCEGNIQLSREGQGGPKTRDG